jgi:hypothetical protein
MNSEELRDLTESYYHGVYSEENIDEAKVDSGKTIDQKIFDRQRRQGHDYGYHGDSDTNRQALHRSDRGRRQFPRIRYNEPLPGSYSREMKYMATLSPEDKKDHVEKSKRAIRRGYALDGKVGGRRGLPESQDLYDVVLDHLLSEGYADDARSAAVIMTHMSDEWLGDIMNEAMVEGPRKEKLAQKRFGGKYTTGRDRANAFNIAVRGDSTTTEPSHFRKLGGRGNQGIRTNDPMQDRGAGNKARRRMGKEPNRVYGPLQPWQRR